LSKKKSPEGFQADGEGFWITFPNGVTVSVRFGKGHYCSNRPSKYGIGDTIPASRSECPNSEVAILDKRGDFIVNKYQEDRANIVLSYVSPMELMDILDWASKYGTPDMPLRVKKPIKTKPLSKIEIAQRKMKVSKE